MFQKAYFFLDSAGFEAVVDPCLSLPLGCGFFGS
jgi:hypothetical protein